jgi:SAM-dependent methyltransferase
VKQRFLLGYAVSAILLSLVMRSRARKLPVLQPVVAETPEDYQLVTLPGVTLDTATLAGARTFAVDHGLEVLDIWPADLSPSQTMSLLFALDPEKESGRKFGPSYTAGHALLVRRELLERAGPQAPANPVEFQAVAERLKNFAVGHYGRVIAPGLTAIPEDAGWRSPLMGEVLGPQMPITFALQLLGLAIPLLGLLSRSRRGLLAFVAFLANPLIATMGTALRPRDLYSYSLQRPLKELLIWVEAVFRAKEIPGAANDARREEYRRLMAGGVGRFFEARTATCPLCGAGNLREFRRSGDVIQGKPGRFTLDRCDACGHIFQNPRLSGDGLDFYYRDVYDGLGSSAAEAWFGVEESLYESRARRVPDPGSGRWLDVGTGYGHFCRAAAEVWPETRFDGLDFGPAIEEGRKRQWLDQGFHGLLTELSSSMEAGYDVVSMSHYLEHAPDPRAEIEATRRVLKPGGYFLIEIHNPSTPISLLLGRWWYGWGQPEHLHFLNERNLTRLLAESGFEAIDWLRAETHWPVEFRFAILVLLNHIAPSPESPWRERSGRLAGWASG